jgi:protein translocase SEC61 complex gamma subunit
MFNIKIKEFFEKCVRVWHILKKPDNKEFKTIAKVSALGILAIGAIGFIISVALEFIK